MRYLVIEPMKEPVLHDEELGYEKISQYVDGPIDARDICDGVVAYFNDEFLFREDMAPNFKADGVVYCGPVVVVGADETEYDRDLSPELEAIVRYMVRDGRPADILGQKPHVRIIIRTA